MDNEKIGNYQSCESKNTKSSVQKSLKRLAYLVSVLIDFKHVFDIVQFLWVRLDNLANELNCNIKIQ
jgi:hypothetical protein